MNGDRGKELTLRERLVLAGIDEINANGVQSFSVRRVAANCGVSCATPYKHFPSRADFFAAIIEYINTLWHERQERAIAAYSGDLRKQLVEVSRDYIRFLVENPHFRSVIMMKDENFDSKYASLRGRLSGRTQELLRVFCASVGMPPEVELRKTFLVRSLIYGAALMFDNGEVPYTEENFDMVVETIDREFDLP